jgi:bacterioferritin
MYPSAIQTWVLKCAATSSPVIELLRQALASEWSANYQYWLGAQVVQGPIRDEIAKEYMVHADEELDHAKQLADRIVELGGCPVITPTDWDQIAPCKFAPPTNPAGAALLHQNIEGEQCAITAYRGLLAATQDTDPDTHDLILPILEKEIEHEKDLQTLLGRVES